MYNFEQIHARMIFKQLIHRDIRISTNYNIIAPVLNVSDVRVFTQLLIIIFFYYIYIYIKIIIKNI